MPRTLRYKRTKVGMIKEMYDSQRSNSKARGMHYPTYTVQELIDWAFSQRVLHELYDNWKSSGYNRMLKPSFDRLDNTLSYTLDNLRIITWAENAQQVHEDQKSGVDNRINCGCAEIDEYGDVIQTWHSTRFAERDLGWSNDSIGKVCRGKRKKNHGRMFKYIDNNKA